MVICISFMILLSGYRFLSSLKNGRPVASPTSTSSVPSNIAGPMMYPTVPGSWYSGTFCHDFISSTFQNTVSLCRASTTTPTSISSISSGRLPQEAGSCHTSRFNNGAGMCILNGVLVHYPKMLVKLLSVSADRGDVLSSAEKSSVALLTNCCRACKSDAPGLNGWLRQPPQDSYMANVIKQLMQNPLQNDSQCEKWIEEDTYFFMAAGGHVYFRFLAYYNLHKAILDVSRHHAGGGAHKPRIVRIAEGRSRYRFPGLDSLLFPGGVVQAMEDLGTETTCFRRVILVPASYSSSIFQCKMSQHLLHRCLRCNGTARPNTSLSTFRRRVLRACHLESLEPNSNFLITIVSRTPYKRFPKDKLQRFQRILKNEKSLVLKIKAKFKFASVQTVRLENLSICEQVRVARSSDVYMGVHGAGLVHLWWLRDGALAYELEPHFERSNPTFQLLAQLAGIRYMKSLTGGDERLVHARVNDVLQDLQNYFKLRGP